MQTSFFGLNQPQPADVSHPRKLGTVVPETAVSEADYQLQVTDLLTLNTNGATELASSQSSQSSIFKKASLQNKQRSQPDATKSAKVSNT